MSKEQIKSSLIDIFNSPLKDGEKRKIVYWEDRDKAFKDTFDNMEIDNVKKHILHEKNYFKTKYILEVEDLESNYLIYTEETLKEDNNNWLLDSILYSTLFYADEISVYSRELGIPDELRKVVLDNKKFFKSSARRERLGNYNIDKFSEQNIEIALISVLTDQRTLSFEESLRTILMDSLNNEENKYLKKIDSFFDLNRFWYYVEKSYGYKEQDKSLKRLLIHMMITTISTFIPNEKLDIFKNFIGEFSKGNCNIFLDRWMNHKSDYEIYNKYAEEIEREIVFSKLLEAITINDIRSIDIFPSIDRAIILYITTALENKLEDFEEYGKLLRLRKTKHFYDEYKYIYEGLFNTMKMFEFKKENPAIPIELPQKMVKSYVDNYYLMDLYYRKFYIAFDKNSSSQILQKLRSMVEGIYINWFMIDLSYGWSESVSSNLDNNWNIPETIKQNNFYKKYIEQWVHDNRKIFIIISDALRYEVAAELCDVLDGESLGSVELTYLIAGLPTNTKFGMARLLPHENMELRDNGFVYLDKINSGNMEGRVQILSNETPESTAISYKKLLSMSTAEITEFYKGKNLNYIYHDTIDAIGDDGSTEIKAFDATQMAIDEISKLIKDLRNYGNATSVYITADHGFIYQRDKLEEVDKISKENLNPVESKRRYMISEDKRVIDGLISFPMTDDFGQASNLSVYIPKANIRFKTQGSGANFVHGGFALQEVVVPLIHYKNKTSGQIGAIRPEKTQIRMTNTSRKITNNIFTLDFFQTERVGGKIVPCSVNVYLVNENSEIISNEEILLGDKTSEKPEDRNMRIQFILKQGNYDRNKNYYLIIKDIETNVEYEKIKFSISLGIESDFDF